MKRFSDRTVIVTGAAGAIGTACALAFAREGGRLFLTDRESCDATAEAARALGASVETARVDVTRAPAVRDAVERVNHLFGRIDILVTVAGVVCHGTNETIAEADWDRTIAVNLKGTFLCCQAVIGPMRARGYGRIVTIGSVIGKNGGNPRPWIDRSELERAGNAAYGASKAGVHALTLHLAKELASSGITVNCVAPGPVATLMTTDLPETLRQLIPVGRMGRPEDVADAVLFLAQENSSFITGEILDINGGLLVD